MPDAAERVAALLLSTVPSPPSPEDSELASRLAFRKSLQFFDCGSKGYITIQEFITSNWSYFLLWDLNHDSKIDYNEWKLKYCTGLNKTSRFSGCLKMEKEFLYTGNLDFEFKNFSNRKHYITKQSMTQQLTQYFTANDHDHNGKLTPEELGEPRILSIPHIRNEGNKP